MNLHKRPAEHIFKHPISGILVINVSTLVSNCINQRIPAGQRWNYLTSILTKLWKLNYD